MSEWLDLMQTQAGMLARKWNPSLKMDPEDTEQELMIFLGLTIRSDANKYEPGNDYRRSGEKFLAARRRKEHKKGL